VPIEKCIQTDIVLFAMLSFMTIPAISGLVAFLLQAHQKTCRKLGNI